MGGREGVGWKSTYLTSSYIPSPITSGLH